MEVRYRYIYLAPPPYNVVFTKIEILFIKLEDISERKLKRANRFQRP